MKRFQEHLLLEANTDDATKAEQLIVFAYNCMYGIEKSELKNSKSWDDFYTQLKKYDKESVITILRESELGDSLDKLYDRKGYKKVEGKILIEGIKSLQTHMGGVNFLIHTGSSPQTVSADWTEKYKGGSDKTPKTDIASFDKNFRISLKSGEGRYMATKVDETKAIIKVALEKAEGVKKETRTRINDALSGMMRDLAGGGGNKHGAFDTKEFKKQFTKAFVEGRAKQLETALSEYEIYLATPDDKGNETLVPYERSLSKACLDHAEAEASIIGIRAAKAKTENLIGQVKTKNKSELDDWIDPMTNEPYDPQTVTDIVLKNFDEIVEDYLTNEMVKNIVSTKLSGKNYIDPNKGSPSSAAGLLVGSPTRNIEYVHISKDGDKKKETTRKISLSKQKLSMEWLLKKIIMATEWEKIVQDAIEGVGGDKFRIEILREAMTGLVKFGETKLGCATHYCKTIGGDVKKFVVMDDSFFESNLKSVKQVSIDLKGGDDKWQIFTMRAIGGAPEPEIEENYQMRKSRIILETVERKHLNILERELCDLYKKYFGEGLLINEGLWDRVSSAMKTAADSVGNAAKSAMRTVQSTMNNIAAAGARIYQYLSEKISTIWNRMKEMVSEYFTKALSWLATTLPANFFNLLDESGIEIDGTFEIDM